MIARLFLFLALLPVAAVAAEPAGGAVAAQPDEPTTYSSDQLVAELTAGLQQHFHCDGELQLDLLRPWTPPARSARHWDLAIAEFPGMASSNMLVRIRLKADGAVVDECSFMVHAALQREVWYTRNPVAGGTPFDPSLLEARRTDVLRQRDTLAARDGDDSFIIARDLPADHMLAWHDVGRRPLVHRGQVVEVRGAEGRLLLTMKAIAMENGARGDLVTVRNPETRKEFPAVVVGDQKVEVHF
jgi:flagella basal body P-ring formation protein FlgA